jgi:glycosyltransferase involved in cell wall biosynthesis
VIDDGSSDNTEEVVKEFLQQDKRVKYIRFDENRGGNTARNAGIKAAKGEYVAFQDSDDEWLPEKLEKQMSAFETVSHKVGVVYTGFWRMENNERTYVPFHWITKKEGDIYSEILKGNYIGTPAVVARKECFDKAGMFDESLQRFHDWELWIRISKYFHFKYINEPLVSSYHIQGSISTNKNALIRALEIISEKHSEDIKKNKKSLAEFYLTIGHLLSSHNEFKKGRDYILKAAKANPLNIKVLLITFVSYFGENAYNRVLQNYRKIRGMGQKGGVGY